MEKVIADDIEDLRPSRGVMLAVKISAAIWLVSAYCVVAFL